MMQWLVEITNGIGTSGISALLIGLMVFSVSAIFHGRKVVKERPNNRQYLLAAMVPLLTGTSYLSILLGTGVMELADGRIYHIARWIDACFVSPLIVLNIVLLLGPLKGKQAHLTTFMLTAIILTMAGGLFAGLQTDPVIGWIWYGYGSLAYLGSVVLLLITIPKAAEQKNSISLNQLTAYRRYASVFVVLSLAFPVIWFFTPAALGQLTLDGEVIAFLPFDLATKVGLMVFVSRAGERLQG